MLNQLRNGLKVRPEEQAQKPAELKKYEQMKATGLPVWEGGLQDQPHIWLEQLGVIEAISTVFRALAEAEQKSSGHSRQEHGHAAQYTPHQQR